jgi:hypothetical protein
MSDPPRYLTYAPWQGQLNNTRICFETVLILAYISGRIFVLPDEYRHRDQPEWQADDFRPLHPGEFLDLERLAEIVPMISREDYARGTAGGWQYDVIDIAIDPSSTVFCYPEIPPASSAEARRLQEFAAGRETFLQLTPDIRECRTLNLGRPLLEPFCSFFYFSDYGHELECKRLIRDHVGFRPSILKAGARIAAYLGDYAALHVRRGDFFEQRPEQDLTPAQIIESVRRVGVRSGRLYIASDETDRDFFVPVSQSYQTYFFDDFAAGLPPGLSAEEIACIEQVVCAFAEVFIGTRLSTFSAYITRLRGYYRVANQAIHFTDGSLGSEIDDDGSPAFSWVNWVRGGNPLWGREYREAWTFDH